LLIVGSLIFILLILIHAICLVSVFILLILGFPGGLSLLVVTLGRRHLLTWALLELLGSFTLLRLRLLQIIDILKVLKFLGLFLVDRLILRDAHILLGVLVSLILDLSLCLLLHVWVSHLQLLGRAALRPIFLVGALDTLLLLEAIVDQLD
jgi:hypothetical protein